MLGACPPLNLFFSSQLARCSFNFRQGLADSQSVWLSRPNRSVISPGLPLSLPRPSCFVARQPILDRSGGVYGYELLARSGNGNIFDGSDPTAATCRTIDTSLLIGTNSLTEGRRAFINCTREILLSDMVTVLPSKVCVLEILEDVEPDREVLERCRSLRKSGYTLAMDDYTGDLKYRAVL